MTPSLEEARRLLKLARDDHAAFLALAALPHIRPAVALFHAQQAMEKSLKAVLLAKGLTSRKTHDLYELVDTLAQTGIDLPFDTDALTRLSPYAVEFRYGEETLPRLSAEKTGALSTCLLAWAEGEVNPCTE
jgi:HEPN domain-containing protein